MLRRSRIFRHLFLDVAQHPSLMFRSFVKVLARNRVNVTYVLRAQGKSAGQEAFAIPVEYTIFLSGSDYEAVSAIGEEVVEADLAEQFRVFLKTPAGRVYDTPYLQGVSFSLAVDTQLGLERNEYYFAWKRNPLVGVVGRLDLWVRGERVESFDVPAVPALGVGTSRKEDIRLDRVTDDEVYLPPGVSLWVTHEAGRLALLNRSRSGIQVLVDTVVLPPDEVFPLRDGSRVAVGPDISLSFVAERSRTDSAPVVRKPTRGDIEEVLGLLGVERGGGAPEPGPARTSAPGPTASRITAQPPVQADARDADGPTTVSRRARPRADRDPGDIDPAPVLGRLEVVGSLLTTQMFEYVPGRALSLGCSPRCHIVLQGAGIRPVHAVLVLDGGGLYLGNRSGRHAVYCGSLAVPVRPGARCPVAVGDRVRLGGLHLHLEPPFSPIADDLVAFFGANYLGNLIFSQPQARLLVGPADTGPITVGRDQTCGWALESPYLWPIHAEVQPRGEPTIRPAADPLHGRQAVLFVNMQEILTRGQTHPLRRGDRIVIGNLIVRYTAQA